MMNKIHLNVMLSLALTIVGNSAFAQAQGHDVGHGGNAVICGQSAPVVLDYYNATLGTMGGATPNLVDLTNLNSDQVVQLLRNQLAYREGFLASLEEALKNVGPISNWIATDLVQVADSDEPYYLPTGCVRKTAAIRQDPYQMYGDPSVINSMSDAQKGLLLLHEAIYLIAANRGQTTSTSVRNFMRVALQKNPKPIDLSNVISGLGGDPTDNSAAYHVQSGIYSGTSTPDYGSYKFQVTVNSQNHMIHIQSLTTVSSWGVVTIDMDCSGMHYSGGAANACSVIAPSASTYWGGINSDGSLSFGNSLADNAGFSFFDIVP